MEVKQLYVTRQNPREIFQLIENELLIQKDTQIFIDKEIYLNLAKKGYEHSVFWNNCLKGTHYYHDDDNFGGEEWFSLTNGCAYDTILARISFIANTSEYMQVVNFYSANVKSYTHYHFGFKQLLLIHFENITE